MNGRTIVVVGAGPAGLVAGITAARRGASVIVIERNLRAGIKLALTGQGRCNITNAAPINGFFSHVNNGLPAVKTALRVFFRPQLREFLADSGISFTEEADGRIFPVGTDAKGLGDILVRLLAESGGKLKFGTMVTGFVREGDRVTAVEVQHPGCAPEAIACDAVILAAGGHTYVRTGSDGSGFALAASLGHGIIPPVPGLAALKCAGTRAASGAAIADARVVIWAGNRKVAQKEGSVLFTHEGLSGPAVLNASGAAARLLAEGSPCFVSVDPFPDIDEMTFDAQLLEAIEAGRNGTLFAVLRPFFGPALSTLILDHASLDGALRAGELSAKARKAIRLFVKPFRFEVTGTGGPESAMISVGGVDTAEVEPRTMRSRIVPNLHLCGEVLDVDADTGGFNLHCAFATGFLAARAATDI